MAQKIKIGFFPETLQSKSKRGASRLFQALFDTLSAREDVQVYILETQIPTEISHNDSLYYVQGADNEPILLQKEFEGQSVLAFINRILLGIYNTRLRIVRLRDKYKRFIAYLPKFLLRPIAVFFLHGLNLTLDALERRINRFQIAVACKGSDAFTWRGLFRVLVGTQSPSFSNKDIPVRTININQLDVILNFWWFHIARRNQAVGLSRPAGPLMYGWFLDAIPARVPHWQEGFIDEGVFRYGVQTLCDVSDRIVAISRSAANDAHALFGVEPERLAVIPCGLYEEDFVPPAEADRDAFFRSRAIDPNVPILMALGVQEPSKNTINILKALKLVIAKGCDQFQFVFVGAHEGFHPAEKFGHVLGSIDQRIKVTFLGSLEESEKRSLLFHSKLLLYPSLWEGFGIPPLEAMAAGVPVIVSDVASLPEVCGEHALYCDPYAPEDIAEKIVSTLGMNPEERERRVGAARAYAREWLWSEKAVPLLIEDIKAQIAKRKKGQKTADI